MNVRLHHERVATHGCDRFRHQHVPGADHPLIELLQCFRPEQTQVIANPPPIKIRFLLPIAQAHHEPQGAMLFRQVLQLVVIEVAAQPHRRQHDDRPVIQAAASILAAGGAIHVLTDQIE